MKKSEKETVLMTPKKAKDFLNISIPTLNKLVKEGKFKKYHIPNTAKVYYKKDELLSALEILE
jgi:predicted site-specific integrase-resolvase